MDDGNVVRFVPGEYVAAATETLPDAATSTEEVREAVLDVPNMGRLGFTCRRMNSAQGPDSPLALDSRESGEGF
jgi:hypothetical protein